jgi:hypothetical protein
MFGASVYSCAESGVCSWWVHWASSLVVSRGGRECRRTQRSSALWLWVTDRSSFSPCGTNVTWNGPVAITTCRALNALSGVRTSNPSEVRRSSVTRAVELDGQVEGFRVGLQVVGHRVLAGRCRPGRETACPAARRIGPG